MGTTANTLLVVGDSLAVGDAPHLARELPGWSIDTRARDGKETAEGVAEIRAAGPISKLVVSLGTNDDPRDVDAFRAAIGQVLAAVGPTGRLVWPDIVSPPRHGVSYDGFNEALAEAARSDARLTIADWSGVIRADPSWLDEDGIHVTDEGYRARAGLVAEAVRRMDAEE